MLHLDIGGGTSNLALYERGELRETDCLNVGGRLVKVDDAGRITYVSPAAAEWTDTPPPLGAVATPALLEPLLRGMAEGLARAVPPVVEVLSFSGGVADCMWSPPSDWRAYGDIGPLLGPYLRARLEGQGYELVRGAETIRATVIGAGAHSVEVSGSTIFYRGVEFPLKNLPVLRLSPEEERGDAAALSTAIRKKLRWYADEGGLTQTALALGGERAPSYRRVREMAQGVRDGLAPLREQGFFPVVAVESDMAKALGQAMYAGDPLLCLDGVELSNGDYIDIGAPVHGGAVVPVVVKTLAFEHK